MQDPPVPGTRVAAWFAYIEMWLTDAGLLGTPQWEPAYRDWLAYFERLGIREVGMGWLLLTKAGRECPFFEHLD